MLHWSCKNTNLFAFTRLLPITECLLIKRWFERKPELSFLDLSAQFQQSQLPRLPVSEMFPSFRPLFFLTKSHFTITGLYSIILFHAFHIIDSFVQFALFLVHLKVAIYANNTIPHFESVHLFSFYFLLYSFLPIYLYARRLVFLFFFPFSFFRLPRSITVPIRSLFGPYLGTTWRNIWRETSTIWSAYA